MQARSHCRRLFVDLVADLLIPGDNKPTFARNPFEPDFIRACRREELSVLDEWNASSSERPAKQAAPSAAIDEQRRPFRRRGAASQVRSGWLP